MNKRICVVAMLALCFVLTGCSLHTPKGTYIGSDGYAYIFNSDGGVNKYNLLVEDSSRSGNWNKGDKSIDIVYDDSSSETATVDGETLTIMRNGASMEYKRVDESGDISRDDCRTNFVNKYNGSVSSAFDVNSNNVYEYAGLSMDIPYTWEKFEQRDEDKNEDYIGYQTELSDGGETFVGMFSYVLEISTTDMGFKYANSTFAKRNSSYIVGEPENRTINGNIVWIYNLNMNGYDSIVVFVHPQDVAGVGVGGIIEYYFVMSGEPALDHTQDIDAMINSICTAGLRETSEPTEQEAESESKGLFDISFNTVDPEYKELLDSYEDFVDAYIDFLNNMDWTNATMNQEYLNYMNKLSEFEKKLDDYNYKSLSDADIEYYTEVMTRVSQKLSAASATF